MRETGYISRDTEYNKFVIFIFLKHLGFADFPIINSFFLSVPAILQQHKTVMRSIAFFDP